MTRALQAALSYTAGRRAHHAAKKKAGAKPALAFRSGLAAVANDPISEGGC
jgi:hypothetical protein